MRMRKVREITVAGFSADPNPNVTQPADNLTFDPTGAGGDQSAGEGVEGHAVAIRFVDGSNVEIPGASANFTTWAKEEGASLPTAQGGLGRNAWVSMDPVTNVPSARLLAAPLRPGRMFVQVTALNSVGTATKAIVYVAESASVAG